MIDDFSQPSISASPSPTANTFSFDSLTRSQLVKALGHTQKSLSREALVEVLSYIETIQTKSSSSSSSENAISADFGESSSSPISVSEKESSFPRRKIALRVAYAGWHFHGFVYQPGQPNTVESHLFHALQQAKLITNKDTCDYSMAGRTDAGVSALGQVIALFVRDTGSQREVDYIKLLNSLLPEHIRITGWAGVSDDFSARLSARSRNYKYFFPRGSFDITCMREAARMFVGQHDFRSFSKLDRSLKKLDSTRVLYSFEIESVSSHNKKDFEVYAAVITGQSFLWHQIRCMMAVLFEVGLHRERPSIVAELLNVSLHPRKPQYAPVSSAPLVLMSCAYPGLIFQTNFQAVSRMFSMSYLQHMSQAQFLQEALCSLSSEPNEKTSTTIMRFNFWGFCERSYTPLLNRPTEGTDETDRKRFVSRAQAEQKNTWDCGVSKTQTTLGLRTSDIFHRIVLFGGVLIWVANFYFRKRTQ